MANTNLQLVTSVCRTGLAGMVVLGWFAAAQLACADGEASAEPAAEFALGGGRVAAVVRIEALPFVDSAYSRRHRFDAIDNPKLSELRERFRLDEVVAAGKDEFERQVLLMDWTHRQFRRFGRPSTDAAGALEILEAIEGGHTFFCKHYVEVLVSCAASLGWVNRPLALRRHRGAATFELAKRLARATARHVSLSTPDEVAAFIAPDLRAESREVIRIILLNTKLRFQHMETIALGSINECTARIAEILRPAVVHTAHSFILVHNHPSGDPLPSQADIDLTRRLNEASRQLGLRLQDHLIIGLPRHPGDRGFFSFREGGLL